MGLVKRQKCGGRLIKDLISRTVVCSGIFKVPFGPECLAAGQLRPSGAMTMKKVKNAVGIRTVKHMHNTEDARVKVSAVTQIKDKKKGESKKKKKKKKKKERRKKENDLKEQ